MFLRPNNPFRRSAAVIAPLNSLQRRRPGRWDIAGVDRLPLWQRLTPPQLFVGSFAMLIALGTLGMMYLPGLYTGEPLSWLDALFTVTSAVCVTGLIVVDTATYFTPAGQAYVLLLIQLGGLGILAFSSLIIVILGRRLSLRQEELTGSREALPHIDPRRMTYDIVRFTLIIEGIGAFALFVLWIPRFGWSDAAWHAVFHSVSAFCNAGFSTYSDNLMSFQRAPFSLGVIMLLIVAGGLGFLTLEEGYLRYHAGRSKQIFRISLHSRLVIITTVFLILAGWVLFAAFEWDKTLANLPVFHKLSNALFLSVTCRTAGYNSIDYAQATDSSNFLTILLMMIGGSPGSTAGGIKTTTFALIGIMAWSRLKGYQTTDFACRSIREETTDRAVGLFVVAFGMVTAGIFALTAWGHAPGRGEGRFLAGMFEAVSAFCTVGLSMGITPELSAVGRWTAILLMFFGRVGPLTLAAALTIRRTGDGGFRYAYEDVVVG